MGLVRGGIYLINFPYTFDPRYPKGKRKFALVLQNETSNNAVAVLLITSEEDCKDYHVNVTIELGSTMLVQESYVICDQPYTLLKSLFRHAKCYGKLSSDKMDEVDEALYIGLCMGQNGED